MRIPRSITVREAAWRELYWRTVHAPWEMEASANQAAVLVPISPTDPPISPRSPDAPATARSGKGTPWGDGATHGGWSGYQHAVVVISSESMLIRVTSVVRARRSTCGWDIKMSAAVTRVREQNTERSSATTARRLIIHCNVIPYLKSASMSHRPLYARAVCRLSPNSEGRGQR